MNYFKHFPRVFYSFGDTEIKDVFENLTLYSDVVDQVKDNIAVYTEYYIQPDERPDQASFKIYDTTDYHWTFYLMNPKLREQGWPISNAKLFTLAQERYNAKVITTLNNISQIMKVGRTIRGLTSGAEGVITHRNLELGQIWIKQSERDFISGETATSVNADGVTETIVVQSYSDQYNAAHHYKDGDGNFVDLSFDPITGDYTPVGALTTEVTWLNRLEEENNELKEIKIIKPTIIADVVESFREAVRV